MRALALVAMLHVIFAGSHTGAAEGVPQRMPTKIINLRDIKHAAAVVSVDAKNLSPEYIRWEIGISKSLYEAPECEAPKASVTILGSAAAPPASEEYKFMKSNLRIGETAIVTFAAGINRVDVGFAAQLKQRGKRRSSKLTLNIQPWVKLPSGNVACFSEFGLMNASSELEGECTLDVVSNNSEVRQLWRYGNSMGYDAKVYRQELLKSENVRLLERVRKDEPALERVAEYWNNVAKNASLYIRVASEGTTLAADIRYPR